MKSRYGAPERPGLKHKFISGSIFAAIGLITACGDHRPTSACLRNGDVFCDDDPDTGVGGGGDGGAGSGNCSQNPYYKQPCDNGKGTYLCNGNGIGVTCVPNPGSGGTGSCVESPLYNKDCDAGGVPGIFVCAVDGINVACVPKNPGGGGSGPGTSCYQNPAYNALCDAGGGKTGHMVCEAPYGYDDLTCLADPNPGGTGTSCTQNPAYNAVCDAGGKPGHIVCKAPYGLNDVVCVPDNPGGGGSGGGPGYSCADDEAIGTNCNMGAGICTSSDVWTCTPLGDGKYCPAVPGSPNPQGEVCGNGLDDSCNGVVDESPCVGGGGSGGGGPGPHGEATCTVVSSAFLNVQGAGSLYTFKNGSLSVVTSNPLGITLSNNEYLVWSSATGLSVSTTTASAKVNVWEVYFPGDPSQTSTIDSLHCLLSGIIPATPENCNAATIGDRHGLMYMSHIGDDWECWYGLGCDAAIVSHVPSDLFGLTVKKVVEVGAPLSGYGYPSERRGLIQMPPKCP